MKNTRAKVLDPLSPEVLAVIRSAFDGYNEPEPEPQAVRPRRARRN